MICLSVNVTPQMSICLPPPHGAFLKGNSNGDPTPWASLPLGVPMTMALQGLVGVSRDEVGQGGPGRHLAALKGGAWGEHPILAWRGRPGGCQARVSLGELGDSLCLWESLLPPRVVVGLQGRMHTKSPVHGQ